jgi:hypothetical protein
MPVLHIDQDIDCKVCDQLLKTFSKMIAKSLYLVVAALSAFNLVTAHPGEPHDADVVEHVMKIREYVAEVQKCELNEHGWSSWFANQLLSRSTAYKLR